MQRPLTVPRRVEVWDRALQRIRETLRAAGLREVSNPRSSLASLLRDGSGPIYRLGVSPRPEELGTLQPEEVHRLEWYRTEATADGLLGDVEALTLCCFEAAGQPGPSRWRRVGLLDLLDETLGLALRGDEDAGALRHALASVDAGLALLAGAPAGAPSDALTLGTWDAFIRAWRDRFLVPWLRGQTEVGVHLGEPLAGRNHAHRFETFVNGVACAWRHDALQDPGLPVCVGASLELDRLLMVACGAMDPREIALPVDSTQAVRPRGRTVTKVESLLERGLVNADALPELTRVEARLAVGITPAMQSVLTRADDPIGLQFVPDVRELRVAPEERSDPIGDELHTVAPGLIQRYPDRVLLKPTHLCAVYCRFCFRRDVVGDPDTATLAPDALASALAFIRERPQIWEVILTGGDPLVLAPARLAAIITSLVEIPHVRVIRIHTRVPLVAPERVSPALVRALRAPKPVYVVLHANHVTEFTPASAVACAALVDAGIPMLSQSVLLKGVNDSPEALEALLRELVIHRIKPYYLHHPDLVEGTSHLRVPLDVGRRLVRSLRGRVSGLCLPTYVLDIPGGYGKVPAEAPWIEGPDDDGSWRVTDPSGVTHRYNEP